MENNLPPLPLRGCLQRDMLAVLQSLDRDRQPGGGTVRCVPTGPMAGIEQPQPAPKAGTNNGGGAMVRHAEADSSYYATALHDHGRAQCRWTYWRGI
jgi:hypothetical protein